MIDQNNIESNIKSFIREINPYAYIKNKNNVQKDLRCLIKTYLDHLIVYGSILSYQLNIEFIGLNVKVNIKTYVWYERIKDYEVISNIMTKAEFINQLGETFITIATNDACDKRNKQNK